MIIHYCINCWTEIAGDEKLCPKCGADQEELRCESYVSKLIRALNHPEPNTCMRAAMILGNLRANDATAALAKKLDPGTPPYLAAAAAEALGEIGNDEAIRILHNLYMDDLSIVVKVAAAHAFARAVKGHRKGRV